MTPADRSRRNQTSKMDETQLRQLEKHFKLRVKTGCETCRIRRVKCDETKPACTRCTKTGRKCEGYSHVTRTKKGSPTAAASYRNSSFLVVPQKPIRSSISRNPSRSLSPDPRENRTFHYFQTYTLPRWTEFFDSELWSRKVLQLSHIEPAIQYGVMALSSLHERLENTASILSDEPHDFAFVQYMQAVRHSNELLSAYQEGTVDFEKVLIACIIFTCYENLAGNYKAANMHLRNGMRILKQHRSDARTQPTYDSIGHVLHRFDLQAMTFSDNSSPYDWELDNAPECSLTPGTYTSNTVARNDLVQLLRSMLWVSGIADTTPNAPEHPAWLQVYTQLMGCLEEWELKFARYEQNMPPHEKGDSKIIAGNTLLKMYTIITRTIASSGAGLTSEMAWDGFVDSFKAVVDLAQTLPILQPRSPALSRSSSPGTQHPPQNRPLAPNPNMLSSTTSTGVNTLVFRSEPSPLVVPSEMPDRLDIASMSKRAAISFSPSFELSPIIPLFLTVSRCRDPMLRRRALALLLNYRRREGVWDSLGAGMVGAAIVRKEEDLGEVDIGPDNWLPFSPTCNESKDVPEWRRVQDIHIAVDMAEGQIDLTYAMANGDRWSEQKSLLEAARGSTTAKGKARTITRIPHYS